MRYFNLLVGLILLFNGSALAVESDSTIKDAASTTPPADNADTNQNTIPTDGEQVNTADANAGETGESGDLGRANDNVIIIDNDEKLGGAGYYQSNTKSVITKDMTSGGHWVVNLYNLTNSVVDGEYVDENGGSAKHIFTTAPGGFGWFVKGGDDRKETYWNDAKVADITFQNMIITGFKPVITRGKDGASDTGQAQGIFKLGHRAWLDLKNLKVDNIGVSDTNNKIWGGVLEIANNSRVRISDSVFNNINIEGNYYSTDPKDLDIVTGGVIYLQGNQGSISGTSVISYINDSEFTNNTLTSSANINAYGGAIYGEGEIENISGTTFKNNSVVAKNEGVKAYGGAIAAGGIEDYEYLRRGQPVIGSIGSATVFRGNSAIAKKGDGYGGAIYSSGKIKEFYGTQFYDNYVSAVNAYGGAIASTAFSGKKFEGWNPNGGYGSFIGEPATIESIRYGRFNDNYVVATNEAKGGAIYTGGNSNIITGLYYNNHANGELAQGGALYNAAGLMKTPDKYDGGQTPIIVEGQSFIKKVAEYISGYFEGNFVKGKVATGGAIYNEGFIKNLKAVPNVDGALDAVFTGNYAKATDTTGAEIADGEAMGGALYNDGKIRNMNATFDKNYVLGAKAHGGALANKATGDIENIEGDTTFTNNYAISNAEDGEAKGGAFYSLKGKAEGVAFDVGTISATFTGNYVSAVNGEAYGGGIFNDGVINKMDAKFEGNHTKGKTAYGGAFANADEGIVNEVTSATFKENYALSDVKGGAVFGGALSNATMAMATDAGDQVVRKDIGKINSEFEGNYAVVVDGSGKTLEGSIAYGGGVFNDGIIGEMSSEFKNNYVKAEKAYGGAFANADDGVVESIVNKVVDGVESGFTGNYALSDAENGLALGGAVYNLDTVGKADIGAIDADFINNYAEVVDENGKVLAGSMAAGGGVFNDGAIGELTSKFEGNHTKAATAYGGALTNTNTGRVDNIKSAMFIKNYALSNIEGGYAYGGAILSYDSADGTDVAIKELSSTFTGNYAAVIDEESGKTLAGGVARGGAIDNNGNIETMSSEFEGNYVKAEKARGGAFANTNSNGVASKGNIGTFGGTFKNNYAFSNSENGEASGGGVLNDSVITKMSSEFEGNYVSAANAYGGALVNTNTGNIGSIESSKFTNNYALSNVENGVAAGGAILSYDSDKNAVIDKIVSEFVGNYAAVIDAEGKTRAGGMARGGAVNNNGTIATMSSKFKDNYVKAARAYGGAVANTNKGIIDKFQAAEFDFNYALSDFEGGEAMGGAFYNLDAEGNDLDVSHLDADFNSNYASADKGKAFGGAIYNEGKIDKLQKGGKEKTADSTGVMSFLENKTVGDTEAHGGAIFNSEKGVLGSIVANFVNNVATAVSEAFGGAIDNNGVITDINGGFGGNSAKGVTALGGAIHNVGDIASIGDDPATHITFAGNYADGATAMGGAVYNKATLGKVTADFDDNYADGATAMGGAIYTNGSVGVISGTFNLNKTIGTTKALGGAVYAMSGSLDEPVEFLNAEFTNNHASIAVENATRAAGEAKGGAVYGNALKFTARGLGGETKFQGNTADGTQNAIYVAGSDKNAVEFAAFDKGKVSVYDNVDGENYDMTVSGDGSLGGDNALSLANSQVVLYGMVDNVNTLTLGANSITRVARRINTKNYVANQDSLMHLGRKAYINVAEDYTANSGILMLDLSVDANAETVENGRIDVGGDVIGETSVIVNAQNDAVFKGLLTKFVNAPNDTVKNENAFTVARVYGSSFAWEAKRNAKNDKGSAWYLAISENSPITPAIPFDVIDPDPMNPPAPDTPDKPADVTEEEPSNPGGGEDDPTKPDDDPTKPNPGEDNPGEDDPNKPNPGEDNPGEDDPNKPNPGEDKPDDDDPTKPNPGEDKPNPHKPVVPSNPIYEAEIAAYTGLQTIAVEQNRSIANSVAKGIAAKKSTLCYQETCGVAELMPKKEAWIDMTYENATIDAPADMDAKISGTTLGIDFYRIGNERAGLFGAYRHGKYDLSGKGRYYARSGSEVTNKSWLGGAYYQYDDDDWKVLGTVFAGKQAMDIKTDDRLAFADTDAKQYGASAEVSKRYALTDNISLSPSLGLYYTMVDIDSFNDNLRKRAEFDTLHYGEAEFGVAVEYVSCNDGNTRRIYAKPSVIRTFANGGKMRMGDIDRALDTFSEKTLGRIELGGNFGINDTWNGYAETGYTFGSDYKAYDFTVGLGYRF